MPTASDVPARDEHRPAAFSTRLRDGASWWNAANARLYGYDVPELRGDLEMVLQHKHAGDRRRLRTILARVADSPERMAFEHRVLDRSGRARPVVSAFDVVAAADGELHAVGTTVDLADRRWARSDTEPATVEALLEQVRHLERGLESRDLIGQAKGVVMAQYRVGADEAFRMLSRLSQEQNVKLVELARRVIAGVA